MSADFDDGGPAFPCKALLYHGDTEETSFRGMTLRDWFAGQALMAIPHIGCGSDLDSNEIACAAYQIADAMLEARKGGQP